MINAFVFIEAEPTRVQELVSELAGMKLASSVIKEVHALTGRYDLVALVESPDLQSLGDWVTTGIANTVGVRRTETALIVWSELAGSTQSDSATFSAPPPRDAAGANALPLLGADAFYDSGNKGCGEGPLDEIAGRLRRMQPGQTLEVRATDPSVGVDLPAWCRMTGNTLVVQQDDRYLIQRKKE